MCAYQTGVADALNSEAFQKVPILPLADVVKREPNILYDDQQILDKIAALSGQINTNAYGVPEYGSLENRAEMCGAPPRPHHNSCHDNACFSVCHINIGS